VSVTFDFILSNVPEIWYTFNATAIKISKYFR
jgi:hypothetical protein